MVYRACQFVYLITMENIMKCTICGKPVLLVPSAKERANKYGGKPSDYTKLFTEHSACVINKRNEDVLKLMRKMS